MCMYLCAYCWLACSCAYRTFELDRFRTRVAKGCAGDYFLRINNGAEFVIYIESGWEACVFRKSARPSHNLSFQVSRSEFYATSLERCVCVRAKYDVFHAPSVARFEQIDKTIEGQVT